MTAGADFLATFPDGTRRIFASVKNAASFRKCMSGIGAVVTNANADDFKAAGVEDGGAQLRASASFRIIAMEDTEPSAAPARPLAVEPARAPAVAAQPPKPRRFDLAAVMRKQQGRQTEEEKAAEHAKRSTLAQTMSAVDALRGWRR